MRLIGRGNTGTDLLFSGCDFVSRYFEHSQPLGIISRLKTNFNPSPSYSAHTSNNVNYNISMAELQYFT